MRVSHGPGETGAHDNCHHDHRRRSAASDGAPDRARCPDRVRDADPGRRRPSSGTRSRSRDRRVEWDARLTNCTLLSARPLGKGGRIRTNYSLLGWVDSEYTSWQPFQRSAVKCIGTSRGNPIQSFVASWNFTPTTDGATVWKTQIVLKGVGGARVAPLVERLMIGPLMAWLTKRAPATCRRSSSVSIGMRFRRRRSRRSVRRSVGGGWCVVGWATRASDRTRRRRRSRP